MTESRPTSKRPSKRHRGDPDAVEPQANSENSAGHDTSQPSEALDRPLYPRPAMTLGRWQSIAFSVAARLEQSAVHHKSQRATSTILARELSRYYTDMRLSASKARRHERLASNRIGKALFAVSRKLWERAGRVHGQLLRVDFDATKHSHDSARQEQLLEETEKLTRRLVEDMIHQRSISGIQSIGHHSRANDRKRERGDDAARGSSLATSSVSTPAVFVDEEAQHRCNDDPFETQLRLLNTLDGNRPLRDYQRSALRWMINLYDRGLNGILADEMGLGKTVQTLALLCYFAEFRNDWGPHLIVVPTTVVMNWTAECQRWCPGLKVLTYIGTAKERLKLRSGWTRDDAFHICITTYNLVVNDRTVFRRRPWGMLILDEAHHIKNFASQKWQALFDLQAQHRLMLTGTPLQNSVMELWSLFHFLLPFASAFHSDSEFRDWFSNPMSDMVEGRSELNESVVRRLQSLLRPFLLRRLKKDVESQLPTKTEKVVLCRLSRRQRALYDDYLNLGETRSKLRGGGVGGVLGVILALRKVCNHPDLFAERPTRSPFIVALPHGAHKGATIRLPRAVMCTLEDARCRLPWNKLADVVDLWLPPLPPSSESLSTDAVHWLEGLLWRERVAVLPANKFAPPRKGKTCASSRKSVAVDAGMPVDRCLDAFARRAADRRRIMLLHDTQTMASDGAWQTLMPRAYQSTMVSTAVWIPGGLRPEVVHSPHLCPTLTTRMTHWATVALVEHVAVVVPKAANVGGMRIACALPLVWYEASRFRCVTEHELRSLCALLFQRAVQEPGAALRKWYRANGNSSVSSGRAACMPQCSDLSVAASKTANPWRHFCVESWPLLVRSCFNFPERRLLIHDCGKLQILESLLKSLRAGGHRALIFTQFTLMLNLLEKFLACIGVSYLRIDGSTKPAARQQYVELFNATPAITCMVLSTRSGGIGLNLTGADTVVFYDSDWNPTVDLQAQDRCHRIGQTRPVTIFRLVSEHTVEEKILEKARERKMLNNIVIRGGQFHAIADVSSTGSDGAVGDGGASDADKVAAAYASLTSAISLKSFFHDLDEDATVVADDIEGAFTTSAVAPSASTVARIMAEVEDDDDRGALRHVEDELQELQHAADEDNELMTGAGFEEADECRSFAAAQTDAANGCAATLLAAQQNAKHSIFSCNERTRAAKVEHVRRESQFHNKIVCERWMIAAYGCCHLQHARKQYDSLCENYGLGIEDPPWYLKDSR